VGLLPAAEFAINSSESESTGLSLFQATKGYTPRMSFDVEAYKPLVTTVRERIIEGKADAFAHGIEDTWKWYKANIARA